MSVVVFLCGVGGGESYYATLEAAVAAVQSGDTIVLLSDLTQDNGILYDKEGVNAKLNLNGKTITVNNGSNINSRAFRIDNGTLEVYGGSIVAVGSGTTDTNGTGCYGAFRVEAAGKLVAHDLSLTNSRPWGLNVKVCGGEAELTKVTITSSYGGGIEVTEKTLGGQSQKGKATLTNCTFDQKNYFDHCSTPISVSGGSELTVNSGTYTSENHALYVFSSGGVITVNGGTFQAKGTKAAIVAEIDLNTYPTYTGGLQINGGSYTGSFRITSPAYMSITGGTFDHDPSAYVAAGYEAVKSDDNWNVQPKSALTVGDGGTYESLAAAINAAESGSIVKLVSDVNVTSTIYFRTNDIEEKDFTLDLNGHKIASTATLFYIGNDSNITINDSGSNGTIDVAADEAIYVSSGKVTLESGALSVHGTSSYTYGVQVGSSGTFVMDGGSITIPSSSTSTYNYCVSTSSGVITINGGDLVAQASGGNYAVSTSGGVATVNGGTIIAYAYPAGFKSPYVFYGSGSKTITGGYFKAIGDKTTYSAGYLVAEEATATISGGYFGGNYYYGIPAEKVADGYEIITLDGSQTDEADAAAYSDGYKFAVKAKQS